MACPGAHSKGTPCGFPAGLPDFRRVPSIYVHAEFPGEFLNPTSISSRAQARRRSSRLGAVGPYHAAREVWRPATRSDSERRTLSNERLLNALDDGLAELHEKSGTGSEQYFVTQEPVTRICEFVVTPISESVTADRKERRV